jgi:hypothetical protein
MVSMILQFIECNIKEASDHSVSPVVSNRGQYESRDSRLSLEPPREPKFVILCKIKSYSEKRISFKNFQEY